MHDIYIIEFSSLYHKRHPTLTNASEYTRGFMLWLIFQGHVVSFSNDATTRIDGYNVSVNDKAKEIFNNLKKKYQKHLDER